MINGFADGCRADGIHQWSAVDVDVLPSVITDSHDVVSALGELSRIGELSAHCDVLVLGGVYPRLFLIGDVIAVGVFHN